MTSKVSLLVGKEKENFESKKGENGYLTEESEPPSSSSQLGFIAHEEPRKRNFK